MFFIKKGEQYWNGTGWSDSYRKGIVYGSAAAAIAKFPRKNRRECLATPLTSEEFAEFLAITPV